MFYILALFLFILIYITMTKITYTDQQGNSKTIEVENGLSVMEGAIQNDVPGIDAIAEALWHVQLAMFMSKKNG